MGQVWSYYRRLLEPWLCLVVYLWALLFQASYGTGYTPLLARLADASAILWTVVFWTGAICAGIALLGLILSPSPLTRANKVVCWVCGVWITAVFFIRWFEGWRKLIGDQEAAYGLIFVTLGILYLIVRWCRKRATRAMVRVVAAWRNGFSYVVLPVLLFSAAIIGIKIAGQHNFHQLAVASPTFQAVARKEKLFQLPNVIVVVADTLRAQSMSTYGNPEKTTPSIDRFAENSSVYLNTHSNATTTTPSMLSLFTGKHPFNHGRLTRALPIRLEPENVVNVLAGFGYTTAAITSNVYAAYSTIGLDARLSQPESTEFNYLTLSWLRNLGVYPTRFGGRMYADLATLVPFLGYPNRTSVYGEVDETLDDAKQAVAELRQPFFLSIHVHQPHEPYPAASGTAAAEAEGNLTGIESKNPIKFYARYQPELQPLVDNYKSRYEDSVRMMDKEMGAFFRVLEGQSWFGKTLIVFTSDHGESFERGYLNHGEELYENSTHVPLVIRFPGQNRGERVAALTQTVDIAPTILRTLKIPLPAWMDG